MNSILLRMSGRFRIGTILLGLVGVTGVANAQVTTPDQLDVPAGFKVDLVLAADKQVDGSWISMTVDHNGRLLLAGQRGQPVTRLTVQDGRAVKHETLKLGVTEVMGMLDTLDGLYVNGSDGKVFGLFRCRDTDGDDQYDKTEMLREWKGGAGEHGAHGIVMREGKLYTVCGNFVDVPEDVSPDSPHRNYADDLALPRAEDGNGFGAGKKPPGGYIVRMDPDGRNPELFASGQRNTYDIAFNADGELFGFDSDMEWDWGMPWYRPTRVFHAVSGGESGFREGSAKWPTYYFDSLNPVVNIGIGSPTGVAFGYGSKFPAKYQKALYILDWSYGRVMAVHLAPEGASYTASFENFVAPKTLRKEGEKRPLNVTDVAVGKDGALYFTIGGRNTAAALYRVSYAGSDSTAAADSHDAQGADARQLRHQLETFHEKPSPKAIDTVWAQLGSNDRYIRYAARIALERQPVDSWNKQALEEKSTATALAALLALARYGDKDVEQGLLDALAKFPINSLPEDRQLEKLRILEVCFSRHGKPEGPAREKLIAELGPVYPAKSWPLNRELCQLMLALESPDAVGKTMKLLETANTQEEQIQYVHNLRTIKTGWTPELRERYFKFWTPDHAQAGHPDEELQWFADAGRDYGDGASFPKFLSSFHADAVKTLDDGQKQSLAAVLAAYTPPGERRRPVDAKPRTVVKEWTMGDIEPALADVGKGRNFRRAREAYEIAQCAACHKMGNEGGSTGPDLTAISSRFGRRDVLESIIDPSKVVSEQYQNTAVALKRGTPVVGRVVEETDDKLVIQPDPLKPDKVEVKKSDIQRRQPSKVSPMPQGLINVLSKEEVLDLLAYLEAGGKRENAAFRRAQ